MFKTDFCEVRISRYEVEGKRFTLLSELVYEMTGSSVIKVPKGFKCDLASVPRIIWPLIGPYGKWTNAAIVHDYLYSRQGFKEYGLSRKSADLIFYFAMRDSFAHPVTARLMYWAVRLFGFSSFEGGDE